MSGTMSCSAPVVSMTMTVVVSVMRVAPPMNAAAPTCTQVLPVSVCKSWHATFSGHRHAHVEQELHAAAPGGPGHDAIVRR